MTTCIEVVPGLFKEPVIGPLKSKMAEIRHLGCWCQNAKTRFSGKQSNLYSYGVYWRPIGSYVIVLFKQPIIGSLISKITEIGHLENQFNSIYFEGGSIWIKLRRLNDMSTAVMWSKSKPHVEFQYGGRLGEFNDMSSQSHVSHCRVLPLGEFTVTIPKPHATLQVQSPGEINVTIVPQCRV